MRAGRQLDVVALSPPSSAEITRAGRPGTSASSKRDRMVHPGHEPSFGARPVPGRSGSDSLLVPEPSPSRRLHSDPLRAGTSRAPDAGGVRGQGAIKVRSVLSLGERGGGRARVAFLLLRTLIYPRPGKTDLFLGQLRVF